MAELRVGGLVHYSDPFVTRTSRGHIDCRRGWHACRLCLRPVGRAVDETDGSGWDLEECVGGLVHHSVSYSDQCLPWPNGLSSGVVWISSLFVIATGCRVCVVRLFLRPVAGYTSSTLGSCSRYKTREVAGPTC